MLMDWSEWVVVFVLIMVIIGPQRMPEYAAKLARGIRSFRIMADGAKAQLKEQMGRSSTTSTGGSTTRAYMTRARSCATPSANPE
jgi:Sec-independent protein translocase protein TatA